MNARDEYGAVAKSFHWFVLALLLIQYALGWLMPHIRPGAPPETLASLHLSFGLLIGAVMLVRLGWRLVNGVPPAEASLPPWQRRAAEALHGVLYLLIFAVVLTGWSNASVRGWQPSLFGLAPLPALFAKGSATGRAIGHWHSTLIWVLLAAVGLHVAAALAHALVWRDRVMQRMLPRKRAAQAR
ncbi:MAG TPA: cytochrome b [Alphaproteobacteria bacterium]|nr:cytochrome b [Alphaproteobacteria bacterium]